MALAPRTGGDLLTPWQYLQQHSAQNWLWLTHPIPFNEVVQSYDNRLKHLPPGRTIILAEPDPIKFLAVWVAATSSPHRLVLANPNWQSHEWTQVYQVTTPDIIIGTAPPQVAVFNNIPTPTIDTLPASAILIPTGGSSGQIKFAIHSWETLTAAVFGLQDFFQWEVMNFCCTLPLYHVSGLMQAVRTLVSGGTITLHAWAQLKAGNLPPVESAQYCLSLVPTQLSDLLDAAVTQPTIIDWLQPLRAIFLGGAPAWPQLLDRARSHGLPIAPTYGMTETAAQIATLKPTEFLQGQTGCGKILPHAQVVVDSAPETPGPIAIQAASLMRGYWPPPPHGGHNHGPSQGKFYPDDLGYVDRAGYLHIVGRSSDKIISGGENIFPAEVEAAIRATQLVQDVYVVGLADDRWGEIVAAVVAVPDITHPSNLLEQLQIILGDRLSKYKQPKRWLLVKHLPRQANGKLAKSTIQSWLRHAAAEG